MSWPLLSSGIWLSLGSPPLDRPRAALFLDRDGIIVEDIGFLCRPADVRLIDATAGLIAAANRAGVPVVVVTNQSGIARGLFGWADFAAVEAEIADRLGAAGARLDAVAACPFHPDHTPGYGPDHAAWRKPAPGLLDLVAERLNIDKAESWLVGDRARDVEAACAAGLAGGILVTGDGEKADPDRRANRRFRLETCPTVSDAVKHIEARLLPPR